MRGKLIVFEGVEGCGKSTQIHLCQQWLEKLGLSVVLTREPGGTALGTHLRQLLLEKSADQPIANLTELILYTADRAQHVAQELLPNLDQGKYILCDRYTDSTIAYQGYGRGFDLNLIKQLNQIATNGLISDVTIWLDVHVEEGLARKRGTGNELDRIEQETLDFHHRVQQGYATLAATHPSQIFRVDGSWTREIVQEEIQEILGRKLGLG